MLKKLTLFLFFILIPVALMAAPCEAPFSCLNVPDHCDWQFKTFNNTAAKTAKVQYSEWREANHDQSFFEFEVIYSSSTQSSITVHYRVSCSVKVECRQDSNNAQCER